MRCHFSEYHPIVLFIYFASVIGFAMFLMHPIYLVISISAAISYLILLRNAKSLKYMIPIMLLMSCINPMFNHKGATILFYLPSGNPFTQESVVYGIASSLMIITVIAWFGCYNKVVTSDKLMYIFGKILPHISLIFSMVLRYVPMYKQRFSKILQAQKLIGMDIEEGSWITKIKKATKVLSIMTTWSMEAAIETSDSMKARGYGLPKRTAYSNYKITKRDIGIAIILIAMTAYIIEGIIAGNIYASYFPVISYSQNNIIVYIILCYTPIILSIMEELRWKYLISKI